MKFANALLITLLAAGCSRAEAPKPIDQTFTSEMASQALSSALPNYKMLKVFAVCGPAAGKGLSSRDKFSEFEDDGISDGRLIFYSASDGSGPNVAYRDISGKYQFALNEGAEVRPIGDQSQMWIISYATTGVVETHNFVMRDGELLDVWTSAKPELIVPASSRIFTSNCFRP